MRILIIKMSSMGDIIHTFPAVMDLKRNIPEMQIDWLVDANFVDVLKLYKYSKSNVIDKVIAIPLRKIKKNILLNIFNFKFICFLKQLRNQKYDLVIDAQGLIKSAIIAKFVDTSKIFGFDFNSCREPLASIFYQHKVAIDKNLHAIFRTRQLFAKSLNYDISEMKDINFGIDRHNFSKLHELSIKDINNYIVFLHGTTWETKRWNLEYWQKLANLIAKKNISIVVMTSNSEEYLFASQLIAKANITILNNLTIEQVASVLSNAIVTIAVDTGLAHLAGALNVPVIGIYGATSVIRAGVIGVNCYNIQSKYHCSPCLSRTCLEYKNKRANIKQPCLQEITPEIVVAQLEIILGNH